MVSNIVNLTRKHIAPISSNPKINVASINSMPEMVLDMMIKKGNKSILHVDLNQCGAAIISKSGINTVYTDSLSGCNSVGSVIKLNNGQLLMILSHYLPENIQEQMDAITRKLKVYEPFIDKSEKPKIFMNIRGYLQNGNLLPAPNPIISTVKETFNDFFPNGIETQITPYPMLKRPPFYSSANIFQFDANNLNNLKITNVGEKESYVDLTRAL